MIPCDRPCSAKLVCKPVAKGGTVYRCAAVLAATYGVTRSAVYHALYEDGNAERVGRKARGRKGGPRKVVQVGPHGWPTISEMARDLGVSRRQLSINLKSAPDRVLALVMRRKG